MNELIAWLEANRICFRQIDDELIDIEDFGKMLLADLSGVNSIFKANDNGVRFNLMESPDVLMQEEIYYVAFPFGDNFYYYDLREEFRFNLLRYIGKRQLTQRDTPFVNLGVHTPFELLNGSGDVADWVRKAKYLGHTALGICDYNTMAATLTLQKECAKAELKHIFGYSFSMNHLDEKVDMKVYALTDKGLRNLLRIQKSIMVDSEDHTLTLRQLLDYAGGLVLVLGKRSGGWLSQNRHIVLMLKEAFGKLYFQVDLSEYKAERIDVEVLHSAACYFENFADPVTFSFEIEPILICDCYYLDKDDSRNKIILNKVATGAAHEQSEEQYFKDVDEHFAVIKPLFSDKWDVNALFERLCKATVEIAEQADAKFETGKMYMPEYIMRPEEKQRYKTRRKMFHSLLNAGLVDKVSSFEYDRYLARLKEEIYIIESTNNVDYFLIQWDMVSEARKRGIAVGIGRGSAGGSLVSYLLGITSIDPMVYDLLFSRFLVPERCGLIWSRTTIIKENISLKAGEKMVEVILNGKTYQFDPDAKLIVMRDDVPTEVYADELKEDDDIVFDRRDLLWTLNEAEYVTANNDR
jgi:DNA polymerase-3 subunit alpha|nr:MAG TPA: DNA polymerase III, alpha subunit [Caudoviricetes sp.]